VRPPAAFACDDLVTAFPIRTDGDRLHEPFRLDRVSKLFELVDVEQLAGLIQVPVDEVNRDGLQGDRALLMRCLCHFVSPWFDC
jgi:hypothetical protein